MYWIVNKVYDVKLIIIILFLVNGNGIIVLFKEIF